MANKRNREPPTGTKVTKKQKTENQNGDVDVTANEVRMDSPDPDRSGSNTPQPSTAVDTTDALKPASTAKHPSESVWKGTPVPIQMPTVVAAPPASKTSRPKKPRGTLSDSMHAPGPSEPRKMAPLTELPAIRAVQATSLVERLAARRQTKKEEEKVVEVTSSPWMFGPRPGTIWPMQSYLLDPAGPHRTLKDAKILSLTESPNVLWVATYGENKDPSKGPLRLEATRASLREKLRSEAPDIKELATAYNWWSLVQLPDAQSVAALLDQRVVIHRGEKIAIFFYPVQQIPHQMQIAYVHMGREASKDIAAILTEKPSEFSGVTCQAISTFFGIPEGRVEEIPGWNPAEPKKIAFRICLTDPKQWEKERELEEEELDALITWTDVWTSRKSMVRVCGSPAIDLHMAHPCCWCHASDHAGPKCQWALPGIITEGETLSAGKHK